MIIGIPKEVKDHEYRVGMIPAGVLALVSAGHQVLVQDGAGLGSGIPNEDYVDAGAELVIMGATRRLFTEEAWRSVSARVMDKSHLPVLLVPGTRIEDTQEMPIIEL